MPVLSVDLACKSWADLGVAVLEQKGAQISCDIIRWDEPYPPPVVELALRLNQLAVERGVGVLMLDGPQAWKADGDGLEFSRVSEHELNTSAKTGLPGVVLPGTYERFVGYCLALYDALARLGWQRLASRDQRGRLPDRILVESYPHAAWKSLGLKPLPAKRGCRVSDLAEAWAALTNLLPITSSQPPNHDQMQAIVGGLPGLALEDRAEADAKVRAAAAAADTGAMGADAVLTGSRIVGIPPSWEGGHWREGFIVLPIATEQATEAAKNRATPKRTAKPKLQPARGML
jgi:hypothetical protein